MANLLLERRITISRQPRFSIIHNHGKSNKINNCAAQLKWIGMSMKDYVSERGSAFSCWYRSIEHSFVSANPMARTTVGIHHSFQENKLLSLLLRDCLWLRVQKCHIQIDRSSQSDSILAIARRTMETAIKTKLFGMRRTIGPKHTHTHRYEYV